MILASSLIKINKTTGCFAEILTKRIGSFDDLSIPGHQALRDLGSLHVLSTFGTIASCYGNTVGVMTPWMECSLHQYLQNNRELPVKVKLEIFSHVLKGLVHVHSQGYLHRDIKPENILMDSNGIFKSS
jgi:serine/threonine protein kinase